MISLAQISPDFFCNSTHPSSSFLSLSIFLKKKNENQSEKQQQKKTQDNKTKQTEIK